MKPLVPMILAVACATGACANDLDEPWQLDHDRIIAVRATPPHIPAGAMSRVDVLVGTKGAPVREQPADEIFVVSPQSLATSVIGSTITAPTEGQLATARAELALAADAPVPLVLGIVAAGFSATKTVWLGDRRDNPPLADVAIGGMPPGASIVVPPDQDVTLFVTADDAVDTVNWLTSCGTMHDFDLHAAYLRVEPDDPQQGELAVVLRDPSGGVSWQVWPIRAE